MQHQTPPKPEVKHGDYFVLLIPEFRLSGSAFLHPLPLSPLPVLAVREINSLTDLNQDKKHAVSLPGIAFHGLMINAADKYYLSSFRKGKLLVTNMRELKLLWLLVCQAAVG